METRINDETIGTIDSPVSDEIIKSEINSDYEWLTKILNNGICSHCMTSGSLITKGKDSVECTSCGCLYTENEDECNISFEVDVNHIDEKTAVNWLENWSEDE